MSSPRTGLCCSRYVDGPDLARQFALGGGARLSEGPVARGKQGVVWRLDTTEGSWAVKAPFTPSQEDEVRLSAELQEAAYLAECPRRRSDARLTGSCSRMWEVAG